MKQDTQNGMKLVSVNVDQMAVFVIINKGGMIINASANIKNCGVCDKGFIWNPSNCECECDTSCDVGEYLDYEKCKCRKKLVDKLVENVLKMLKK